MPAVRSAGNIGEKFARVTSQRTPDYQSGVSNPRRGWNAATRGAVQTYKDGIAKSLTNNSFEKGVAKVSDASQIQTTLAKGPTRFAEGVQQAGPKFQAAVEPYLATIASVTLPPRYPKGDPRNIARVAAVADALNKKKLAGG